MLLWQVLLQVRQPAALSDAKRRAFLPLRSILQDIDSACISTAVAGAFLRDAAADFFSSSRVFSSVSCKGGEAEKRKTRYRRGSVSNCQAGPRPSEARTRARAAAGRLVRDLLRRRRRPPPFIPLDVVGQDPARRQREAPVSRGRDVVLQQADRDPDEDELLRDGGDGQCERRCQRY